MLEYKCSDVVFHFNKKHLEDPTVPMWVLKSHGVTFYVNHVDAEVPWSTKETPDNSHTKGSLKFKKCKLTIDEDNCATLSKLSLKDLLLSHPKVVHARVIADYEGAFHRALKVSEFKHSKIKEIGGDCGSSFIICDLLDKNEALLAAIKYAGRLRILSPNEKYYQQYEQKCDYINEYFEEEEEDDTAELENI